RHEEGQRHPAPRLREVRALARIRSGHDRRGGDRDDETPLSSRDHPRPAPARSLLCDPAMRRHLGTFLLVIGLGVLAWAATVYFWKDPFTTAYTAYEQRRLASKLDEQFASYEPLRTPVVAHPGKPKPKPAPHDDVKREARRFRLTSDDGDAIARLKIPGLGLSA